MLDFKEKRSYLCSAEFRRNSASNTGDRQGRTDSKEFASFRFPRFRRVPQRLEGFGLIAGKVVGSIPVSAAIVKLGTSYWPAMFEECSSFITRNPRKNGKASFRDDEGFFLYNTLYVPALRSATVIERLNLTGSPTALDSRLTEELSPCKIIRLLYRFARRSPQSKSMQPLRRGTAIKLRVY
jgi:hypothetical protein